MRWGARKEEFVRPTQWLVMLLGDQVIDCTILAQKAGRDSRGHRFHHPENVRIGSPSNYLATCVPPTCWPTPTSVAS
jgi:glycyl-tRNA synthetase beta chain